MNLISSSFLSMPALDFGTYQLEGEIATGKVFQNETLSEIANHHQKTVAQVVLRWIIQQGIAAIPRSGQQQHAQQNLDIFDFSLSDREMAEISTLQGNGRLVSPAELAPEWDLAGSTV